MRCAAIVVASGDDRWIAAMLDMDHIANDLIPIMLAGCFEGGIPSALDVMIIRDDLPDSAVYRSRHDLTRSDFGAAAGIPLLRHPRPRPRCHDGEEADAGCGRASLAGVAAAPERFARSHARRDSHPQSRHRHRRARAARDQRRPARGVDPQHPARRPRTARARGPHVARAAHAARHHHVRRREPRGRCGRHSGGGEALR